MARDVTPTLSSWIARGGWRRHWRATGVGKGDTVAILAPNIPEMLEAHNARPRSGRGAVSDQYAARRRRRSRSFCVIREAKVVLIDRELSGVMRLALAQAGTRAAGDRYRRSAAAGGERIGAMDYETFIGRRRSRLSHWRRRTTNGRRSR